VEPDTVGNDLFKFIANLFDGERGCVAANEDDTVRVEIVDKVLYLVRLESVDPRGFEDHDCV
jgi:hypothetical protein